MMADTVSGSDQGVRSVGKNNAQFLDRMDAAVRAEILNSIANHYAVSPQEILEEVTSDDAEHLLEYMVEPLRSVTALFMKQSGFQG